MSVNLIEEDSKADLSAISYEGDVAYADVDTQEESALFRDLERSTTSTLAAGIAQSQLCYSADEIPPVDDFVVDTDNTTEEKVTDEVIYVEIKDGEPLEIVVASVEALLPRSFCGGLRVLSFKKNTKNNAGFRKGDIITAVNGLSIQKMSGERALALIKTASNRKIHVLRKPMFTETADEDLVAGKRAQAQGNENENESQNENEEENDDEETRREKENLKPDNRGREEEEQDISGAWGSMKRRYTQRLAQAPLYAAGNAIKIDTNRYTEPTMSARHEHVPGGKRCPGKGVYSDVLHRATKRVRR